jgi:Cof subfamily protein (haloacid dehalogenase superfamily)
MRAGMSLKLVAIDLDGTLLSPEKQISKENIQSIWKTQNQGHIVMICSGRAPEDIKQILQKYGLTCPIAGSNGSVVEVDSKIIQNVSMDPEDVVYTAQKLDDAEIPYYLYTNQGIFAPDNWPNRVVELTRNIENLPADFRRIAEKPQQSNLIKYFTHYNDVLIKDNLNVNKIFILAFDTQIKKEVISSLSQVSNIIITSSGPYNIEIMHKTGHKGNGLKSIADYYSIPLANTVAIGDNFNDIPMLEMAGLSIAMGNADYQVKNICDCITLTNSKHGVSYALDIYIL